jgi:hypothetical protein
MKQNMTNLFSRHRVKEGGNTAEEGIDPPPDCVSYYRFQSQTRSLGHLLTACAQR